MEPEVDFTTMQFLDLERSFALGNKAALYDAVSRSAAKGLPLPGWAETALKDLIVSKWAGKPNTWSGYKAKLTKYIRSEVYRACMRWVQNKRAYRGMPTRCIQAWYDGKFNVLPSKEFEAAMTVAQVGLVGTPAQNTSWQYLEKQRYFGTISKADSLEHEESEIAESLEMTQDEYHEYVSASFLDYAESPILFGYSETEVLFGLRPPGQFWGPPPGNPPAHIQALIDAAPKLITKPYPPEEK